MWSYEHLYLTCFCLFQSHNLASIFVPTKAKTLIVSIVYFRGGYLQVFQSKFTKSNQCSFSIYSIHAFLVHQAGIGKDYKIISKREALLKVVYHRYHGKTLVLTAVEQGI